MGYEWEEAPGCVSPGGNPDRPRARIRGSLRKM